jgi:hypothetical protein
MKWTRRNFLATGLASTASPSLVFEIEAAPAKRGPSVGTLTENETRTLKAAIDEIIPTSDRMPSASDAGGVAYISKLVEHEPTVSSDLRRSLVALDNSASEKFKKPFDQIDRESRIELLAALEKNSPRIFAMLRDSTYESYYTQPRIWKLIGYEFYPTDHAGPHMKPFDEAVLTEMRKRPKFYREA